MVFVSDLLKERKNIYNWLHLSGWHQSTIGAAAFTQQTYIAMFLSLKIGRPIKLLRLRNTAVLGSNTFSDSQNREELGLYNMLGTHNPRHNSGSLLDASSQISWNIATSAILIGHLEVIHTPPPAEGQFNPAIKQPD